MSDLIRAEGTRYYEEVLERILDHGMVLDGMSHIAALSNNSPISAQAKSEDRSRQENPTAVVSPPRARDRDLPVSAETEDDVA